MLSLFRHFQIPTTHKLNTKELIVFCCKGFAAMLQKPNKIAAKARQQACQVIAVSGE